MPSQVKRKHELVTSLYGNEKSNLLQAGKNVWFEFVGREENLALASFKRAHYHQKHSVLWSTN